MYVNCVSDDAVNRQRRIEGCLLELMGQMPYSKISVSQLCEMAGCSRKAFYRYYANKEGCLIAMLDRAFTDVSACEMELEELKSEVPLEVMSWIKYWIGQEKLLDALISNNLCPYLLERCIYFATHVEREALQWLGMGADTLDRDVLMFANSGLIALILQWHSEGYSKTLEEMAATVSRLLCSPLFVAHSRHDFLNL